MVELTYTRASTVVPQKKLSVDRSPIGILRRRLMFFLRYLATIVHARRIKRLMSVLEQAFCDPWVKDVTLEVRFWPGKETATKSEEATSKRKMAWDAPVCISIWKKRKGKKSPEIEPAFALSCSLWGSVVTIQQLQGFTRTEVPLAIRHWPSIFVEAIKEFARQENFRNVRVPKAESLYSYRQPSMWSGLPQEERDATVRRIRSKMEQHYDVTAIGCGFTEKGDWFVWENPDYKRSR